MNRVKFNNNETQLDEYFKTYQLFYYKMFGHNNFLLRIYSTIIIKKNTIYSTLNTCIKIFGQYIYRSYLNYDTTLNFQIL